MHDTVILLDKSDTTMTADVIICLPVRPVELYGKLVYQSYYVLEYVPNIAIHFI